MIVLSPRCIKGHFGCSHRNLRLVFWRGEASKGAVGSRHCELLSTHKQVTRVALRREGQRLPWVTVRLEDHIYDLHPACQDTSRTVASRPRGRPLISQLLGRNLDHGFALDVGQ